jgi:hypothetical protein
MTLQSDRSLTGVLRNHSYRMSTQQESIRQFREVESRIGISGYYIDGHCKSEDVEEQERKCRRLVAAFMLKRLIREEPVDQVAADFTEVRFNTRLTHQTCLRSFTFSDCVQVNIGAAELQALQERTARYASSVALLCGHTNWNSIEVILSKHQVRFFDFLSYIHSFLLSFTVPLDAVLNCPILQERIAGGVRQDLVSLTQIPYIKRARARALYNHNLREPRHIASLGSPDSEDAVKRLTGAFSSHLHVVP